MNPSSEPYIRRADVSQYFPFMTRRLLDHWAYRNIGPVYTKIGREAYYKISDLQAFLSGLEEQSRADQARRAAAAAAPRPITAPRRAGRPRKTPSLSVVG